MRSITLVPKRGVFAHLRRGGSLVVGAAILTAVLWVPFTSASTRSSAAVAAPSTLATTFYATLTNSQFVNNGGDRARGEGNNPFGNYAGVQLNITVNADERLSGPFPGDFGEYQFALHPSAAHTTSVGSAIVFCQYGFDRNSICDIALDVSGGMIVGKGSMNFDDPHFALAVTGGTGSYRGVKGSIIGTAAGPATQAQPVKRSIPILQSLTLDITAHPVAAAGASGWRPVSIKESPDDETFVDNNDDESRGDVNNPWGAINTNAASIIDEHVNGPFPGDEAFFTFHIKTQSGGTGLGFFMCQYYFARNGFCHATFQFGGGTIIAEGTFNFDAKTFTLAVTGGYGNYANEVGEVDAAHSNGQTQQLSFELYRT
jgi:hypothetical protein